MNKKQKLPLAIVADILGTSKKVVNSWSDNKLKAIIDKKTGKKYFHLDELRSFPSASFLFETKWGEEERIKPQRSYKIIELFAGAGGLALGLEKAGFQSLLLNEIDRDACETLKKNRVNWNVKNCDIKEYDFTKFKGEVDLLTGGFPCQAFSYSGKKLGFNDTRGTLFYEFARAVKETNPKVILAENVKGLVSHNSGKTLETIKGIIDEIGYELVEPKVLKAIFYKVPQKRERIFLVAIRKDLSKFVSFNYPAKFPKIFTLRDALKKGDLFNKDVPKTEGQIYPQRKKEILRKVPQGGYWRDLSDNLQREYMRGSYFLGGGKTGLARRLSWDEPSLTLTCAPAQKQTERCHPNETRPLTFREYARIQTFPDEWLFCGSLSSIYKQIGNAVPVNLAYAVGRSLVNLLNQIENHEIQKTNLKELNFNDLKVS